VSFPETGRLFSSSSNIGKLGIPSSKELEKTKSAINNCNTNIKNIESKPSEFTKILTNTFTGTIVVRMNNACKQKQYGKTKDVQ
jgi:hypothetical protein